MTNGIWIVKYYFVMTRYGIDAQFGFIRVKRTCLVSGMVLPSLIKAG